MLKLNTHQLVNSLWYGDNRCAYLLSPLSILFALGSSLRKRKQQTNQIEFKVPIVVVGNITVGGTGKTPMVATLAVELSKQGYRIGIASRGYKRQSNKNLLVNTNHIASDVGDEPLLIFQKCAAKVMVGEDRVSVIQSLIEDHSCELIICDDGLQDYRFNHDLEIVMVDGERLFGNQQLLPAGPLREAIKRIQLADFVVATAKVVPALSQDYMKLHINQAINLVDNSILSLQHWQGKVVHAIAGIANPERFFKALRLQGLNIIEHQHVDHAALHKKDISFNDHHPVLMTEKDAVKCKQFNLPNTWYIPVNVEFPEDFIPRVLQRIQYISKESNYG